MADLNDGSSPVAAPERYRALLLHARSTFGAQMAALLKLKGDALVPVATEGLAEETLGRAFPIDKHPRLARSVSSVEPVRFAGCDLPDPYDGFIRGCDHAMGVHDCLGAALLRKGLTFSKPFECPFPREGGEGRLCKSGKLAKARSCPKACKVSYSTIECE